MLLVSLTEVLVFVFHHARYCRLCATMFKLAFHKGALLVAARSTEIFVCYTHHLIYTVFCRLHKLDFCLAGFL